MTSTAESIVQFLFLVAMPLLIVAGVVVGLFALGALFHALEHPEDLRQRIEGAFRRPLKAPRETAPDHYYRPYWKAQ
jgi:hypothetical protein